jgi:hypothetical protein
MLPFSLMLHTDTKITSGKIAINTQGLRVLVVMVELVWSQDLHETLLHGRCQGVQAVVEECSPKEVGFPVDRLDILVLLGTSVRTEPVVPHWILRTKPHSQDRARSLTGAFQVLVNMVAEQDGGAVRRGMSVGRSQNRSQAIKYGKSHKTTTTVDVPKLLQICQHLYASSHAIL